MKQILILLCCLCSLKAIAQERDPYDIEPARPEKYRYKEVYGPQGDTYGVDALALVNNAGNGYGLQFRYFPMHDARLALVLPVSVNFAILDHAYSPRPAVYFISPGFRRYTGNPGHAVHYAWGLNCMLGSGKGIRNGNENNHDLQPRSVFGLTFANSLQIQCCKHIHMGLDLNLGFGYDDGFWYDGATPLGQLSLALGYSW